MGNHSRAKGRAGEQEIVRLAQEHGLEARRTWESAQSPNPDERAVDCIVGGDRCQVKRTRDGFGSVYAGLEFVDALYIRRDASEWIVCLRAEDYFRMMRKLNVEIAAHTSKSQRELRSRVQPETQRRVSRGDLRR